MADETTILNAKVIIDASSAKQAQSEFNTATENMAQNTRAKFGDIKAQTNSLIAKSKDLAENRRKHITEIKKLEEEASKSSQTMAQAIKGSFTEIMAAIGVVGGIVATAIVAFNELKKAAEFRGMATATKNLAFSFGVDMQSIMSEMDRASGNTLTMQDKFRLMNEAMLTGSTEVLEKLPELLKIASAVSIATGEDENAVLMKLFNGIERGSSKMINSARIYIQVKDVVKEYADAHGIAVEEVDKHTASLLTLNAVTKSGMELVKKVGEDTDSEKESFERATVAVQKFESVLANIAVATGLIEGFTAGINAAAQVSAMAAAGFVLMGGYIEIVADVQIKNAQNRLESFFYTMTAVSDLSAGNIAGAMTMLNMAKATEQRLLSFDSESVLKRTADLQAKADAVFKRAILPMVGPAPEMNDPREIAQRKIAAQSASMAEQQAATEEENNAKLAKLRDKRNELIIAAGEKARDAESTMNQDIEKLAADHANRMAEIALEGARKREDIALETSRKVEDAETEYLNTVEENQRDTASKRIEIEQRYQERIIQIQRQFEDSYWNAVKSRDAVGLVEAVRNRNRGIQDAGRQRDQDIENADRDEAEKAQKAEVAYQRKLADAQRYYQRALQDQRIEEQRAGQDENLKNRTREQELRNHFAQRLTDITNGLQAELNEANVKYGQSEADYSAHLARMAALAQSYMAALSGYGGPTTYGGGAYYGGSERYRAEGGADVVSSPTRFVAGEGGPELVLTVPLGGSQRALPAPASMSHSVSGDVSHQLNMITTSGLKGMEGRIVAAVMQAMREVVKR